MSGGPMPHPSDIHKRDDREGDDHKGQKRKNDVQSCGRKPSEIVHLTMFSLGTRHHKRFSQPKWR